MHETVQEISGLPASEHQEPDFMDSAGGSQRSEEGAWGSGEEEEGGGELKAVTAQPAIKASSSLTKHKRLLCTRPPIAVFHGLSPCLDIPIANY
jgi:hypothetical protein